MKTFFSRHSSTLDIDEATYNYLWDNEYMAIHYPNSNEKSIDDCTSINPNDYSGSAKKSLNALHKISKDGGYIFAVYENKDYYKIGYVEPETKIELIKGKWGRKNGLNGRIAILKGVKFKTSIIINPIDALSLTCAQPRQGTLCTWNKIGKRVENIYNGTKTKKTIDDLTPDLQEVLCSEFLRSNIDSDLPKLESLLTPVGRTMKDVDIIGLTSESKRVLIQVTHDNEPQWKIDRLQKYKSEKDCILILFCKTDKIKTINNVLIYDIEIAFKKFTSSENGKKWINMIK